MKKTYIDDIIRATGGKLMLKTTEEEYVTGIKHDSREVTPGDMFVAIRGENQDGHKYIPQVIGKGCRTILASHTEGWFDRLEAEKASFNLVIVEDTIEAMKKLAALYIQNLNIKRVAVTGSVGKTSTRDMIYYVLSQNYNCGRNLKNYNNNIGLPISVFCFDEDIQAAVLEMGMDNFGEIEYLSEIVKPEIAVITNIGVAHMEKLGSREGIFRAKMEITKNIEPQNKGGTLIFAGDENYLTKERTKGDYSQIEVGYSEKCDYKISDVKDSGIDGIEFNVSHRNKKEHVVLPLPGTHNAVNATIAIAVGERLGIDFSTAAAGLTEAKLTGSRLKKIDGTNVTIIDDTYNANPASMMRALDVLKNSKGTGKIAILGDMFELGDETAELHRSVGEYAKKLGIDRVIAIGSLARNIADGAAGKHFPNKEAFLKVVDDYIRPGDIVLVKASRGMKMEEIVGRLK